MSICSSLVALMALSFSSPLMKIVCFCSIGFYQCLCNSLVLPPDNNFLYSLSTFNSCPLVEAFYIPLWCCLFFGILAYSHYSPYTCQIQCVSVKRTNRCNWLKVCRQGTVQLWLHILTLAVLDSIGSICIKAVASKIMHSVFSIMLLYLQICF